MISDFKTTTATTPKADLIVGIASLELEVDGELAEVL